MTRRERLALGVAGVLTAIAILGAGVATSTVLGWVLS